MIQIQCTCADVDADPMHSPLVCALDEYQHQMRAVDLNHFSRNKIYLLAYDSQGASQPLYYAILFPMCQSENVIVS